MFRAFIAELHRIWHDKAYLATLTLLPTLALAFFTYYLYGTAIEQLPVVVVDNDKSNLSQQAVEMIGATPSVDLRYSAQSSDEALRLIRSGSCYAAVIIPEGFERSIMRGERCHIALYNSGANISTNGFITKDIQSAVTTFGAAISLFSGVTMAQIAPTRLCRHILFNPQLSYTTYLAPCFMPMMLVVFTILGTVMATTERKRCRLKHLIAYLAPTTLAMTLFATAVLFLLYIVLKVPLVGSITLIFAATLLLIVVYQAIALFFVGMTRSRHLSLSLGGGYSVLAFTFSGLTFPTMAMYKGVAALSYLFPFTYYIEIVIEQSLQGAPMADSLPELAKMAAFLPLPTLVYRRLR